MGTIEVTIGEVVALSSGHVQDTRQKVRFEGEKLTERTIYGISERTGNLTDTRGVTETLYRTADGRYIVHVDKWSKWQGEPNRESLYEASETELMPGGRYADLGNLAGLWEALTLDQALRPRGVQEA